MDSEFKKFPYTVKYKEIFFYGGDVILYFRNAVPNDDYTLNIIYENNYEQEFHMFHLLKQFRFSPLKDEYVWKRVEVFPTHLEWNKGTFQVNLNIEEVICNQ